MEKEIYVLVSWLYDEEENIEYAFTVHEAYTDKEEAIRTMYERQSQDENRWWAVDTTKLII